MSDFGGGQSRNGKEMVQGHIRGAWTIYITDRSFSSRREKGEQRKTGGICKIDKKREYKRNFLLTLSTAACIMEENGRKKKYLGFSLIKVWQYPREMVARYMSYIVQYISSYGGKSK